MSVTYTGVVLYKVGMSPGSSTTAVARTWVVFYNSGMYLHGSYSIAVSRIQGRSRGLWHLTGDILDRGGISLASSSIMVAFTSGHIL